jgi:hypothetical protein
MKRRLIFNNQGDAAGADPVVFVHIPKTAGTSFTGYLVTHFRREEIAPPYFGDLATLESTRGKRFVAGHFLLSQALGVFPNAFFLTFLREPVARIQSQYRSFHDPAKLTDAWRQHMSAEALEDIEFAQRATFEEFVLSKRPSIRGHIDNVQTAFLADAGLEGRAALESAIRNLQTRISFFGIQERFEEALELFRFQTGSKKPFTVPREHRNLSVPADLGLGAKGRRRLEELVALDAGLYAAARRLFWARYTQLWLLWRPLRPLFAIARLAAMR